jgi:phosphoribosylglycinamide formyltransferase-1
MAVLASGEGTTLQGVLDACDTSTVRVVLVISNNSQSGALRRARACGIPALHLSSHPHPEAESLDAAMRDCLVAADIDVVLLAGYMKKLGPLGLRAFEGRVLNTHPALLPNHGGQGMFGRRVHEAVIAAQDRETNPSLSEGQSNLSHGSADEHEALLGRRIRTRCGNKARIVRLSWRFEG